MGHFQHVVMRRPRAGDDETEAGREPAGDELREWGSDDVRTHMYNDVPVLDDATMRELFRAYRAATSEGTRKHLRERLTLANMRLVRSWASYYYQRAHAKIQRSLDEDDLASEGTFGLFTAIEKYDPAHDETFGTYGSYWIRQAIGRALDDKGRTIRVPVWAQTKARQELRADVPEAERTVRLPITVSLDEPLEPWGDNPNDTTLLALLSDTLTQPGADPASGGAGEQYSAARNELAVIETLSDHQALYVALGELNMREREVLELRFGLTDGIARNLAEVGRAMHPTICRERVRQLESKALRILRGVLAKSSEGDVVIQALGARRAQLVADAHKHARPQQSAAGQLVKRYA